MGDSLAVEFVSMLDDEFKDLYMKYNAKAVGAIITAGLHQEKSLFKAIEDGEDAADTNCCEAIHRGVIVCVSYKFFKPANWVISILFPFVSLVVLFVGAHCKP